ncbi:OLC1v1023257C1 [Oldenlandia corymbosa var. corymbosa]|nr:OLC1v1023257C1 [Oldenlandia corymbosa var. corymbosa]
MSFQRFYEGWLEQLRHLMIQLNQSPRPPLTDEDHQQLQSLVQKTMSHYTEYYRVKSLVAKTDVLVIFAAPWSTTMERSLHWIAGWRPTTAFHLIYTEASIRFESQIIDILRGLRNGDLGDLSPAQFRRVSELQCETVREENAITDELSQWQDGASDFQDMREDVEEKMQVLGRVAEKADDLRLQTIVKLVELLTPRQAAEFLIAAAHLQIGVRGWGVDFDLHHS